MSSGGIPITPSGQSPGTQAQNTQPTYQWIEVDTDANGSNDMVYFVTLCQVLALEPNEDPSYSNFGIASTQAVQYGVPPDWWVARMQAAFAQYFASLTIVRATDASGNPVYDISVMFHNGVVLNASVPIPY